MYVYTVTIGRNVGDWGGTPMHDGLWATFQHTISELMAGYAQGDGSVETHRGTGEWEGVREDSAKIALLRVEPLEERDLDAIRYHLRMEATLFGQKAITLTIGQSELIER